MNTYCRLSALCTSLVLQWNCSTILTITELLLNLFQYSMFLLIYILYMGVVSSGAAGLSPWPEPRSLYTWKSKGWMWSCIYNPTSPDLLGSETQHSKGWISNNEGDAQGWSENPASLPWHSQSAPHPSGEKASVPFIRLCMSLVHSSTSA